jgi:outer membrane protein assembly factor BamB
MRECVLSFARIVGEQLSLVKHIARRPNSLAIIALASLGLALASSSPADEPRDWYRWRGPEMNGMSRERNLPESWSPKGENLLWRKAEFGTRCSPIVMNGRIYFICRSKPETTQEGERTVCLDAETGELIWESVHNIFLSDAPAERIGWASCVGDPTTGNIYSLGIGCMFQCLDGATGKIIWQRAMSEEYGMLSTYGGRTNIPEVFEDLVIISGVMTQWGENAVPAHRVIAFDKLTGEPRWFISTRVRPEDTTYSTPVFTTFDGQAAMVFGAADGAIYAVQPRTGKVIWKYDVSQRGFNTTPLVHDNIVYCAHAEKNRADTTVLGAAFALDGRLKGEIREDQLLWKNYARTIGRSSPLMVDGRLYMVEDGGSLLVMDPKTGEVITEKKVGRIMFGSLVYGDGKIYCAEATGNFWIFRPTEEGLEQLCRVRLNNEEILSSPAICNGKIYLTTTEALYCIGQKSTEVVADEYPAALPESPASADQKVAAIQIVPVEALLGPGEEIQYRVEAFNGAGQSLGTRDAEFKLEGNGQLVKGKYTAPSGAMHHTIKVTANLGELTSAGRARVVPPLPWKFDFNDGQVPATWIGAAYRHQPKELDGEKVLVKVSTIPKGTRSQCWMGHTTHEDYTIQADLRATGKPEQKPDMGLVNQRYTLDMMGKNELQIRSWTPRLELRFAKTIPFEWEVGQWYTMKFQSENSQAGATLRGKVWKRGEAEPAEWIIEATDATPNQNGSPGMFGNSSLAEFYIDNVSVYPNK